MSSSLSIKVFLGAGSKTLKLKLFCLPYLEWKFHLYSISVLEKRNITTWQREVKRNYCNLATGLTSFFLSPETQRSSRSSFMISTCVINDPHGQTHSPSSIDHYFHATFVLYCDILNSWDGRTDGYLCEFNDHYRLGLWVGRMDQRFTGS